jgi:hypothetical protein
MSGVESESASRFHELDAVIASEGLHPIVRHALVAMQSDDGVWLAKGMPLDRVRVLQAQLQDAARNRTLARAIHDLQRVAVSVSRKSGARLVATHLALLCDAFLTERVSRAPDPEAQRRAHVLLGLTPATTIAPRPARNGGGALAQLRARRP